MGLKIIFRVDGGRIPGVSLGHVFRCMALARELKKKDKQADVTFFVKYNENGIRVVENNGFKVWAVDQQFSYDEEVALLEQSGGDIIIFDLIDVTERDFGRLANRGIKTVVIDDTGNKTIEADVVINGSIVDEFHRYSRTDKKVVYYLGPKYCILGDGFNRVPLRKTNSKFKSILVTMGGSDPTGLTKWVIDALVDYPIEATITINLVLGPAFGEDAYLLEIIEGSDNKFAIHRDVPNMAEMMFHADFAISSGGMTAYELMATGTPAIIVPSTDVELKVAKAFEHVGAALCISCWDHCGTWKLQEAITMILESSQKMTKISNRGPEIIDGRGRKRVASIIVKEIESES